VRKGARTDSTCPSCKRLPRSTAKCCFAHIRMVSSRFNDLTDPEMTVTTNRFEKARRFVAHRQPADSTLGLVYYLRSFSALGDQRLEILPVQRSPTFVYGAHSMMRSTRILIFPCFLSALQLGCPLNRDAFQNARRQRTLFSERPTLFRPNRRNRPPDWRLSAGPYWGRSDRSGQ
jgi:hypothetical protein